MKKIFTSILLLFFAVLFAQNSSGCGSANWPSVITTTGSTFTVPEGPDGGWSYNWNVTSNLTVISGQGTPTAVIVGIPGTFGTVYVTKDKKDVSSCTDKKNVTVADNCDISQGGIFELNPLGNQNVKFYTMPSIVSGGVNNFSYYWTFIYLDGTTSTSFDREPYISIDCSNPVVYSNVNITSTLCSRTLDRNWSTGVCGTSGYGRTQNEIKVYPNPTTSKIQFMGNNLSNLKVSIFDETGNEVLKNPKIDEEISLDKLRAGTLIYIITDEKGFKQEGKIIKK